MEQFSNACYHPKVFRDWKASLVKSRLSLWCIRRIPCILGSLIYDCRLTTQRPGPAFLLSLLCGLGWEEFPDPYYLSYLGLPKDNSPWKHFLLSLVFFKRPRLCLQGTVTDINSFHLSDVWTIQSNLKDAVVPYPHLPLLGLTLRIHISEKKITLALGLVSGKCFQILRCIGKLWGCLFLLTPGLLVLRVRSVQSSILSTRSTTSNSESCGLVLQSFETLDGIWAQVGSDGKSICLQCGRPKFNPWVR